MIKFIKGDILKSNAQYIAHGVAEGNQEGLGTGLALKISKKWPEIQSAFKQYVRNNRFKGGDIWVYAPSEIRPGVIYLATQPDMYHATIPYLRRAIKRLAKWAESNDVKSVALPKIGAGLGKLSWESDVKPILIDNLTTGKCQFIVYETYKQ